MLTPIIASLMLATSVPAEEENPADYVKLREPNYEIPQNKISYGDDQYDPSSGGILLKNTDIRIPTNSSIPLSLARWVPNGDFDTGGPGEWKWDIPFIKGNFMGMRDGHTAYGPWDWGTRSWNDGFNCSGYPDVVITNKGAAIAPAYYWDGLTLHIPDKVTEKIQESGSSRVTKSKYRIKSCITLASGQEGFVVTSPDGLTYTFSEVKTYDNGKVFLKNPVIKTRLIMASKIEDNFGNSLVYNYENGQLSSIVSNSRDDKDKQVIQSIMIKYNFSDRKWIPYEASYNGKAWRYDYVNYFLSKVTLPDGYSWTYDGVYNIKYDPNNYGAANDNNFYHQKKKQHSPYCSSISDDKTVIIKNPQGLQTKYTFSYRNHDRSKVEPEVESNGSPDKHAYLASSIHCSKNLSLVRREVTFDGSPIVFDYSYSENLGTYAENTNDYGLPLNPNTWVRLDDARNPKLIKPTHGFPKFISDSNSEDYRTVTIKEPNKTRVIYIDRKFSSPTENYVVAEDTLNKNGEILSRTEKYFELGSVFAKSWFQCPCGLYLSGNSLGSAPENSINILQATNHINLKKSDVLIFGKSGAKTYTSSFDEYSASGVLLRSHQIDQQTGKKIYSKNTYTSINGFEDLPVTKSISDDEVHITETSRYEYYPSNDRFGGLTKSIYKFGHLRKNYSYFDNGLIKKISTGGSGQRWIEFSDYSFGLAQNVSIQHPTLPQTISARMLVDVYGNIYEIKNFNNETTSYSYDEGNRLVSITPSDKRWAPTLIEYNHSNGYINQLVSKGNARSFVQYDGLMRPVLSKTWDLNNEKETSSFVRRAFDYNNNEIFTSVRSTSEYESRGTYQEFDALDRLVKVTQPDNSQVITEYLSGNEKKVVDGKKYETITKYLAYGEPSYEKPLTIRSPEGVTTELDYNLFGNVTFIKQGDQTETRLYDSSQRLCIVNRFDVGTTAYGYNSLDEKSYQVEGLPPQNNCLDLASQLNRTTFTYNNHGSIAKIDYYDNSDDVLFDYDNMMHLTKLISGNTSWSYKYNSKGLLENEILTVDDKSFSLWHEYNSLGMLQAQIYPSGRRVEYNPNALGQSSKAGNYINNTSYHPSGQLKHLTFANGLKQEYTLNDNNIVEELSLTREITSAKLMHYRYKYDDNSNVERIDDIVSPNKTIVLGYDGLNRLTSASGFWGSGIINYDTLGNITHKELGTQKLVYSYDSKQNKLLSVSGNSSFTFKYDDRGNITNNGRYDLQFNRANQLTKANRNSYFYDGHNRRVKKVNSSGSEYSFYSQDGRLYSTQAGELATDYIYIGNLLVAKDNEKVPNAPSGLSLTFTNNMLAASWSSVSNATSYKIQWAMNGAWQTEVSLGGNTSSSMAGLFGRNYQFKVRACNSTGCSAQSAASNVILNTSSLPPSLSINKKKCDANGACSGISLSVSPKEIFINYVFEYKNALANQWLPLTSSSFVTPEHSTFEFRVKMCTSGGVCTDFSSIEKFSFNQIEQPPCGGVICNETF